MMFILLTRRQPVMKLLMSAGPASCFETRDLLTLFFLQTTGRKTEEGDGCRIGGAPFAPRAARVSPHPTHGFLFLRLLFTGPQPRPARGAHVAAGRIAALAFLKLHG
jgi:hypothetical protein